MLYEEHSVSDANVNLAYNALADTVTFITAHAVVQPEKTDLETPTSICSS